MQTTVLTVGGDDLLPGAIAATNHLLMQTTVITGGGDDFAYSAAAAATSTVLAGLPDQVVVCRTASAVARRRSVIRRDAAYLGRVGSDALVVRPDATRDRFCLALRLPADVRARVRRVAEWVFRRVVLRVGRSVGHRSPPSALLLVAAIAVALLLSPPP